MHRDLSKYKPTNLPVIYARSNDFVPIIMLSMESRLTLRKIFEMDEIIGNMIITPENMDEHMFKVNSSNLFWHINGELPRTEQISHEEIDQMIRDATAGNMHCFSRPMQEISNILDCSYDDIPPLPWTIDTLTDFHLTMFKETGTDNLGKIRKTPYTARSEDGYEIFVAPDPQMLDMVLSALMNMLNCTPYNGEVTANMFAHILITLKPFGDDTNKIARKMFKIVMDQMGFKNLRYCELEKYLLGSDIGLNVTLYAKETGDYSPLLDYTVDCLYSSYSEAVREMKKIDISDELDPVSKMIVIHSRDLDWFSVADINKWVGFLGYQAVRTRLNDLVRLGILKKEGNTRATRYKHNHKFKEMNI